MLLSNALMLHVAIFWFGKRLFRSSYNSLYNRRPSPLVAKLSWLGQLADRLMLIFPKHIRLLIGKDLRLLFRDPVQWSQFLIFFGLLALYFANVDRFRHHRTDISTQTWVNIASFLLLAVVGLLLSTFTTRFIYPLASLEARRFWILNILPIERDTIVWSKFYFAAFGSWGPCALLVLVSDLMLDVAMIVILVHQFICILLCIGLAGMSVGLGASMPDIREQSPSKIAAGFGGTLNLVLSALYNLAVVLMTALPCHFYFLAKSTDVTQHFLQPKFLRLWIGLGIGGSIVLALLVTILPMRSGLRNFRRLEV